MIEMKQLYFFLTCVETGSISKAAEILYTTQPNVSKVIRIMESQLGVTLFARKGRGIIPTPEGERVYQYAKSIIQKAEYLQTIINENDYNQINVVFTPSNHLATVFADYYNSHSDSPNKYSFREGGITEVITRVEERGSDLGFLYMQDRQMPSFQYLLDRKRLEYHEIRKGKLVVYIGPKNPYFQEDKITGEMLANLNFIRTDEDVYGIDAKLDNLSKDGRIRKRMENALLTNSDHVTMQLLAKTEFAMVSMFLESECIQDEHIRGIPIEGAGGVSFGYVKRKEEDLGQEARRFLEWVIERS